MPPEALCHGSLRKRLCGCPALSSDLDFARAWHFPATVNYGLLTRGNTADPTTLLPEVEKEATLAATQSAFDDATFSR